MNKTSAGLYRVALRDKQFYNWYTCLSEEEKYKIALENSSAFIKGVFDSEGSITIFSSRRKDGKVDRYPCIRIVNSDRQLIEILCKVLKEDFSIESKLAERKPRYTVIDGRICAFKKPVYVLGVYNRDGVNRFLKNIGTSIKRKLIIGGMKI